MNISLAAEPLFHLGSFPVTNTLVVGWVVTLTLIVFAVLVRKNMRTVPTGMQNVAEAIIEALIGMIEGVTRDRAKALKFFPVVGTIFIAVLASNWVELVPGLGSIGYYAEHDGHTVLIPFIRSASADLNFTAAVAIVSFFTVQFFGIGALGLRGYGGKFFVPPWRRPYVVGTVIGILELISEFSKIVSFSFRLFGNIFAGEVLLLVVGTLIPYLVPLPFLFLEFFVGLVQALVFSMLTLVFLSIATSVHGEEPAHAHSPH